MIRLSALLQLGGRRREAELAHALLHGVPLFRELPADDLVRLMRCMVEVELPAGSVVCERGQPGDRFYVLRSGVAEARLGLGPDGLFVRRLGPGECFGEIALLSGLPRSLDIVVVEDAVLWALDRAPFEALTARSVPLLRALNHELCRRLVAQTFLLEELRLGQGEGPAAGMRFGAYRVLEQLGAGGMAVVFGAVHVANETAAVIKVLPAGWGGVPEFRERLQREAAVLRRIHHPHVVRVFEVGELDARSGGGVYLVMEWLPTSLDRLLRAQFPEPLAVDRALALAHGVAEGLAAVHRVGVVHRDVKPSNILLRADGTPVLTDFGLAAAMGEVGQRHRLTPEGVIVGTADYISPEQVAGRPVDGRSDVYSLGVVLYELLAGHSPFAGRDPMETLQAHLHEAPPPLPEAVPPAARAIVEQALEKDAGRRFPSAEAMARALSDALAQLPPGSAHLPLSQS
ncbi:MAG TPA: protein kinase [Chloroflexota bacterium]|nr:protein kinase [Chloroflexota bacterium]